jgi:outer membrane receptor protein involved in Fe transport
MPPPAVRLALQGWLALLGAGAGVLASGLPRIAGAQAMELAVVGDSVSPRRTGPDEVLARLVSLHLNDVPLEAALRVLAHQAELRLSYSSDIVPLMRRVSYWRDRVSAGEAIRELLRGTELDYVVTSSGYVVLVRSSESRTTSGSGNEVESANAALAASLSAAPIRPHVIDRVLVMGTPASGAPERELPVAVSVLTASQIASSGAANMQELFRNGIPGVVAWDLGASGPFAQIGSVRGSSSFTSNYLKTYVDGVELASPYLLFAIDPFSIERMEVIRGPQGSALYGSDAISGVVQVVTRRGSPSAQWKPQFDVMLSGGMRQSRYLDDGQSSVQRHSGFVSTGGGTSSLGFGGTFDASGAVVPGATSGYRTAFGGFRHLAGGLRVEGSARYADIRFSAASNPLFAGNASSAELRSLLAEQQIENETYGITTEYQASPTWRQTLVLGIDRHAGSLPPQREPATVADALLGATQERASRASARYSTAIRLAETPDASTLFTLGAEESVLERQRLGLMNDVAGVGSGLASLYTERVTNGGIFGQLRMDIRRSLFLSAGLRAETNSSFGDAYGTAWSPMLGAAWTHDIGATTMKLRWAYGRGIRPPPSSARRQIETVNFRQSENPFLTPEEQGGFEGGLELYAGDLASLSLTGYRQSAEGLIQQVLLGRNRTLTEPALQRTIQYQNVGRIENRGVEIEGQATAGRLHASLSFALTGSHVRALSETYSGDLAVGDRVPEVPRSSGLGALSWDRGRTQYTVGASLVGSWTGYDWLDFYQGELSSWGDSEKPLREYLVRYPSLVRPYVSLSHSLGQSMAWFVRLDNLTNQQLNGRENLQVTAGRTATVGFRLSR